MIKGDGPYMRLRVYGPSPMKPLILLVVLRFSLARPYTIR